MRIRAFGKVLEEFESKRHKLNNEAVVLDGHNFFFLTYEQSGLPYDLGCEARRYAAYLADRLAMFKDANIKCYFLFKGGWKNVDSKPRTGFRKRPIFTKNIIKEVLEQHNFQFVFCEYESKSDIIELAQTLDCPIISWDLEFVFSGHPYISSPTLEYNASDNSIDCGIFMLGDFLQKYKLTEDKVATFIVLTDELIYPADYFSEVYKRIIRGRVFGVCTRNKLLLSWLSKCSRAHILETIFLSLSEEDRMVFLQEETKARLLIGRSESGGFGAACSLDRGAARVSRADPLWFVKGVASAHIDQEYVNLYYSKFFYGSKALADNAQDDAMVPSLEIVKYAFDLLTNFHNDGFKFIYDTEHGRQTMIVGDTHSIAKPEYEAEDSVFENGWDSVKTLGLLEHFFRSTMQLESLRCVESVPERTRLLLLALAYCSRHCPSAPAALPAAVLLTHVMLDVVADTHNNNLPQGPFEKKPILDSTMDRGDVTETDCGIAAVIMEEYSTDVDEIDVKLLHPLVEYQQCVAQLSALNVLCGSELPPPVFARSYSGTLAYTLLRAAERAADPGAFLDELLSPAPTVYAYFNGIYKVYEKLELMRLFFEAHE